MESTTSDLTISAAANRMSVRSGVGIVTAVFLISRFLLGLPSSTARWTFWNGLDFQRWDSWNYLYIAYKGTSLHVCTWGDTNFWLTWCGTAGWLPGYPVMVRLIQKLGFPMLTSAGIVTLTAWLLTLFVVWYGWLRYTSKARSFLTLLLFAMFTGAIYTFAVFPMSCATLFIVLGYYFAGQRRYILGGLSLLTAGLMYPVVWYISVAMVLVALWHMRTNGVRAASRELLTGVLGLGALPALFIYDAISTHHWNAFFLYQQQVVQHYKSTFGMAYFDAIIRRSVPESKMLGSAGAIWLSIGVMCVLLLVGLALRSHWVQRSTAPLASIDLYAMAGAIVVLASFFYTNSPSQWTRAIIFAAPAVLLLRNRSPRLLAILVIMSSVSSVAMAHYFFKGTLV
jgi:hypothetical protein